MGILAAVVAATLVLTVARNATATAGVNRANVSVIAGGEALNVKQWVVQAKASTAVVMECVCLLHNSVIVLMDGKEQAVIFLIVLECRIVTRLEPATEELIHRYV